MKSHRPLSINQNRLPAYLGRGPIFSIEDRGYKTPCWVWLRDTNRGYGRASFGGRVRSVHVVMYQLAYGPISKGLEIDHLCKVRSCGRPDHLEAVTKLENIRRSSACKLTHSQVTEIRRLRKEGVSGNSVAEMFGVKKSCISLIHTGANWKDSYDPD